MVQQTVKKSGKLPVENKKLLPEVWSLKSPLGGIALGVVSFMHVNCQAKDAIETRESEWVSSNNQQVGICKVSELGIESDKGC